VFRIIFSTGLLTLS